MRCALSAGAALLQALEIPGYGLALIARVRRRSMGRLRLRMGSVYPALKSLEAAGLVRSAIAAPTRGVGRPRRYYELTPRGLATANFDRDALIELLRAKGTRLGGDEAGLLLERVRRCALLSARLVNLRRRVLAVQGSR